LLKEAKGEMQIKKPIFTLIAFLFLVGLVSLVFILPQAKAQVGVGASPGTLHFNNMLRGGYAEGFVTVSVSKDDFVSVTAKPRGQVAGWLEFPEGLHYQVNKGNSARIKVIMRPPPDVANGVYSGVIRFTTSPLGTITSGVGSAIQVSIDVIITVEITDIQFLRCRADGFRIRSTEENQPVSFSVNVLNDGNVRVTPNADVVIWNQKQDRIIKTFNLGSGREILPTTRTSLFLTFPSSDLAISQYWAEIIINPCEDSRLLTFDVLREGTLALDGILKTIITKVWADVGEVVPIIAVFKNIGENPVKATFVGTVELDGRIIELIESDEIRVDVGEEANLTTFFTPKSPGRYIVKGKVLYGIKETFEKTGIINVAGVRLNYPVIAVYLLVVAFLIFIIYRLYKRRIRVY